MRILLTFENFTGPGGTESYTLTVANELDRLGHDVRIYAVNLGPLAEHARSQGVQFAARHELPDDFDALISSDAATCHDLADRSPGAARLFVAHSVDDALQIPPQLAERCQAVIVLNDRVGRAVQARGWHAPVVRLHQPIDLRRFNGVGSGRPSSDTALVLGNYLRGARAEMLGDACRANGLEVRWVGSHGEPTPSPELAIAGARLVIGLGRSVLEAMAAGRAAYVYGVIGGDGWVTPESYPALEADGFGGTANPDFIVDRARLETDLGEWDESLGQVSRDLVAASHTAREHAIALVDLIRQLKPPPSVQPSFGAELARLVRLQWQSEERAIASLRAADEASSHLARMRDDATRSAAEAALASDEARTRAEQLAIARAEHHATEVELTLARGELSAAEGERTIAQEQVVALRQTRRYRLACRLAAPLDRLRARTPRARRGRSPR